MGAKSSKPVAQAKFATRKFPSRPAGQSPAARPPPRGATPSAQPQRQQQASQEQAAASPAPRARGQQASFTKDDAIKRDGLDPDFDPDPNHHTNAAFSQRLRQMGVATPNPTLSNSSIVNSQGSFARRINDSNAHPPRSPPQTTVGQNPSLLSKQQPSPPTSSAGKPTSAASSSALGGAGDASRPFPTTTTSHASGLGSGPNSNAATLNALQVRKQLVEKAQYEFERGGNVDREFLDVNTLRQVLALVEQKGAAGISAEEAGRIEKRLNLKGGVVERLVGGKAKGVFGTMDA